MMVVRNCCLVVAVIFLAGVVSAGPACQGRPRTFQGKKCASTTHYNDNHKGACGCGAATGDSQFNWNHNGYVAAANQQLFSSSGKTWCGSTCGRCVRLTTTGGFVDGQGSSPGKGSSRVFMITNLCPNVWPNLSWCSQTAASGNVNQHGYGWHFDLENGNGQISRLGWNNPEVTWEWVDCNAGHGQNSNTPSINMYHTCQCG